MRGAHVRIDREVGVANQHLPFRRLRNRHLGHLEQTLVRGSPCGRARSLTSRPTPSMPAMIRPVILAPRPAPDRRTGSSLDPNFWRTVVLVGEHSEEGALGVVLNRPSETSPSTRRSGACRPRRRRSAPSMSAARCSRPPIVVLADFVGPGVAAHSCSTRRIPLRRDRPERLGELRRGARVRRLRRLGPRPARRRARRRARGSSSPRSRGRRLHRADPEGLWSACCAARAARSGARPDAAGPEPALTELLARPRSCNVRTTARGDRGRRGSAQRKVTSRDLAPARYPSHASVGPARRGRPRRNRLRVAASSDPACGRQRATAAARPATRKTAGSEPLRQRRDARRLRARAPES